MPWCPNCKTEYREGIAVCADCGALLTDKEPSLSSFSPMTLEQELMEGSSGLLPEQEIEASEMICDEEEDHQSGLAAGSGGVYERKASKAKDYTSSAYVLMGVGGAGLLYLILHFLGVLSLPFPGSNLLTGLVMGVLFAVFFIMGIQSYGMGKKYQASSLKEEELAAKMLLQFQKEAGREDIDAAISPAEDEQEEVLYFKRIDFIREYLQKEYPGQEEGLIEDIAEQLYREYYES